MSVKKILVVDDEEAFLCAVRKVLAGPELEVDTADAREDALGLLEKNRYTAVVADLRLTGSVGEEGLDIARFVHENLPDTTVMLITAYGSEEVRQKAGIYGVEYYFEKPVSIDMLRKALEDLDWVNGNDVLPVKEVSMKARVDPELCTGCGPCEDICPEVFQVDGDVAEVKVDEVPPEVQKACREAAESCPSEAITIEE
jgi:ferredoxin